MVEQRNFDGYPIPRIDELPAVEVHNLSSDAPPKGVGQIAVSTVAPAVSNAIFAATGERVRRLPFTRVD